MIKPINNHLLIEPIKHESFMSTQNETYEEVGIVIDSGESHILPNTKVFFDSWLAVKYPKNEKEYFWLVKLDDIRAIDTDVIPSIPK